MPRERKSTRPADTAGGGCSWHQLHALCVTGWSLACRATAWQVPMLILHPLGAPLRANCYPTMAKWPHWVLTGIHQQIWGYTEKGQKQRRSNRNWRKTCRSSEVTAATGGLASRLGLIEAQQVKSILLINMVQYPISKKWRVNMSSELHLFQQRGMSHTRAPLQVKIWVSWQIVSCF